MAIEFRKMVALFGKNFVSSPTPLNPTRVGSETPAPISPNAQRVGKNERALAKLFCRACEPYPFEAMTHETLLYLPNCTSTPQKWPHHSRKKFALEKSTYELTVSLPDEAVPLRRIAATETDAGQSVGPSGQRDDRQSRSKAYSPIGGQTYLHEDVPVTGRV